jgi:hypothetical protein
MRRFYVNDCFGGDGIMRKRVTGVIALGVLTASPAAAIGLEDLAKVILGGNSVLKKSEEKCGQSGQLTALDNSILDSAVSAVKSSITADRFMTIDSVSRANAEQDSQATDFCPETKKKKKGLLGKIGKAAKGILKGKSLGL